MNRCFKYIAGAALLVVVLAIWGSTGLQQREGYRARARRQPPEERSRLRP